jgi:hypothetical protein
MVSGSLRVLRLPPPLKLVAMIYIVAREPLTMGKQLIIFITCGCKPSAPFFVIYKAGREPTPYWFVRVVRSNDLTHWATQAPRLFQRRGLKCKCLRTMTWDSKWLDRDHFFFCFISNRGKKGPISEILHIWKVEWNLCNLNLLGTSFCVWNKQVVKFPRLGHYFSSVLAAAKAECTLFCNLQSRARTHAVLVCTSC